MSAAALPRDKANKTKCSKWPWENWRSNRLPGQYRSLP